MPPLAFSAHHPSWGLETLRGDAEALPFAEGSLPLMGIGNATGVRTTSSSPRTHYPSWGLETSVHPFDVRRNCLSHYPSWGLETSGKATKTTRRWRTHYPSWGLETSWFDGLSPRGHSSLPLMGIGNDQYGAPLGPLTYDSLPLMGIGNLADRPPAVQVQILITPHGDWKRQARSQARATLAASLPLMGIGNGFMGGIKSTLSHSLPLMGIGNARMLGCDRPSVVALITPHGDWKRPEQRTLHRSSPPHYPSWGLETTVENYSPELLEHSLPLMGIGNLSAARVVPSCSISSLPLMGIGNPQGGRQRREPAIAHYPSWGLETRRREPDATKRP